MMGYPVRFRLSHLPLIVAVMAEQRMMPDLVGKKLMVREMLSRVLFGGQLVAMVLVRCDHEVFVKAQPLFLGGPHENE